MSEININLYRLNKTSYQTIFDWVTANVIKQGGRSTVEESEENKESGLEERCMYRDPYGRKCAAGWLIPDEKYNSNLENNGVDFLAEKQLLPRRYTEFVDQLRSIHDNAADIEDYIARSKKFAGRIGLHYREKLYREFVNS
jgi:hypothetical protein